MEKGKGNAVHVGGTEEELKFPFTNAQVMRNSIADAWSYIFDAIRLIEPCPGCLNLLDSNQPAPHMSSFHFRRIKLCTMPPNG